MDNRPSESQHELSEVQTLPPEDDERPLIREDQCSACQYAWGHAHIVEPGVSGRIIKHHASFESFCAAREMSCDVCSLLYEELRKQVDSIEVDLFPLFYEIIGHDRMGEDDWGYPVAVAFYGHLDHEGQLKEGKQELRFTLRLTNTSEDLLTRSKSLSSERPHPGLEIRTDRPQMMSGEGPLEVSGIFALRLEPMSYGAGDTQTSSSTGSKETLALCRAWLAECIERHEVCGMPSHRPFQPVRERLLDLRDLNLENPILRLDTSEPGADVKYATLSHRWGTGTKLLELTHQNESYLKRGFPLSELPLLFQQVAHVAVSLNINYLWIDSLCIMQDSMEDWTEQAMNMGSIYQDAVVNIASTAAENSSDTIFRERAPSAIVPARITLIWQDYLSERMRVKDCLVISSTLGFQGEVDGSALSKRGWIFQERLLSLRSIHFTDKQVYWECHSSCACEALPLGWPYMGSPASPFKRYIHRLANYDTASNMASSPAEKESDIVRPERDEPDSIDKRTMLYAGWTDIVETYSACDLTKPADKLVALGSSMQQMLRLVGEGDIYLEGHWFSELLFSLLWHAGEKTQHPGRAVIYNATRPKEMQLAPTWSWASVIGAVRPFYSHYVPMHFGRMRTLAQVQGFGFQATTNIPNADNLTLEAKIKRFEDGSTYVSLPLETYCTADGTPLSAFTTLSLAFRCRCIHLEAHVLPAKIDALISPQDTLVGADGSLNVRAWGVKFDVPDENQETGTREATRFGARFAPDDIEDFTESIVPNALSPNSEISLFAIPLIYEHGRSGTPHGLVLEEIKTSLEELVSGTNVLSLEDHDKVDQSNSAGKGTGTQKTLPIRSFVRLGYWSGEDLVNPDRAWEPFCAILDKLPKQDIRLY